MTDEKVKSTSGKWLGEAEGLRVRMPGDLGLPVLEIHGSEGMAAVAVTEDVAERLPDAASELVMALDEHELGESDR